MKKKWGIGIPAETNMGIPLEEHWGDMNYDCTLPN